MKVHTVHFVVLHDEQGIRVRCGFCGGVLFSKQGDFEAYDLAEFSANLVEHNCFKPDAIVQTPTVNA